MPELAATPPRARARVAVVGVSESRTCGVRDHAALLAGALEDQGVSCSMHWLWRNERSLTGARAEFRVWTRALEHELARARPDAIVLHYSVFSYSHRGVPVFVAPTLAALRRLHVPVVSVMHEFAYPWRRGGLHGSLWALTQRAALIDVMRTSSGIVVTAPFRVGMLSKRWLAKRPIVVAPVFSNLPRPSASPAGAADDGQLIGLFGYAYEGAACAMVLDAQRLLRDRGLAVRLELLGAPGPDSPAAARWRAGARARGIEQTLSFTGVLSAQELSDALAACDVLLHPEPSGPTSRKGTLAGSLASGTAVVAIDGPRSWPELLQAHAAVTVQPSAGALAGALAGLLGDQQAREALGARGGDFAARSMSVERSAVAVADLLEHLLGGEPGERPRRERRPLERNG